MGSLVSRRRFALAIAGATTPLLLTTMSVLECLIRERLCVCVPWAIQLVCRRDDSVELDPSFLAFGLALHRLVCAVFATLDALFNLIWEWPQFFTGLSIVLVIFVRTWIVMSEFLGYQPRFLSGQPAAPGGFRYGRVWLT